MGKPKEVVIDVRNAVDFAKRHAEGSLNIPLPQLEERLDEIKKLNAPITCVCGGGTRNKKAYELLSEHGIESVAGGSWKKY